MKNLLSSIYSPDVTRLQNLSSSVKLNLTPFVGEDGQEYASLPDPPNPTADRIGGRNNNGYIRKRYAEVGQRLRSKDLDDINEDLKSAAHTLGFQASVWYRVAQIPNGIEIDLSDDRHRRIAVTPGRVEMLNSGSQSVFIRNPHMGCISVPEDVSSGNLSKFDKYLNMTPESRILTLGWLTFSIAQPKVENSK